jgi:hypothetical protein
MQHFMSPRGLPLVYSIPDNGYPQECPVLTVENYCKWYSLFLVHPDGRVEAVDYDRLEPIAAALDASAYVDHVPNPACLEPLCDANGWILCTESREMAVGRWQIEVAADARIDSAWYA